MPEAGSLGYYEFSCLAKREPTYSADFFSGYRDLFCHSACAYWYCHGSQGACACLDMGTIEVAYANLVGKRSGRTFPVDNRRTCRESELLRVEPGAPERSLLYLKISDRAPCGTLMPPPDSHRKPMTASAVDQIE